MKCVVESISNIFKGMNKKSNNKDLHLFAKCYQCKGTKKYKNKKCKYCKGSGKTKILFG